MVNAQSFRCSCQFALAALASVVITPPYPAFGLCPGLAQIECVGGISRDMVRVSGIRHVAIVASATTESPTVFGVISGGAKKSIALNTRKRDTASIWDMALGTLFAFPVTLERAILVAGFTGLKSLATLGTSLSSKVCARTGGEKVATFAATGAPLSKDMCPFVRSAMEGPFAYNALSSFVWRGGPNLTSHVVS